MSIFSNPAIEAGAGRRGAYVAPAGSSFIRRQRVELGLTQPEAAKHCRVSLRTFQRAESGDCVDMQTRRCIERALGALW